jgi:hypothetical protein
MRYFFSLVSIFLLVGPVFGDEIRIIKSGKDYRSYSHGELQRRVWDLEMAVFQLQRRVFELEAGQTSSNPDPNQANWICTIKAPFGQLYTATGTTKAIAKDRVIEKCKAENSFDSHCAKVECEH